MTTIVPTCKLIELTRGELIERLMKSMECNQDTVVEAIEALLSSSEITQKVNPGKPDTFLVCR
jgi:hypothetical protein